MVGFSYRRVVYDFAHQHYAKWPIIGNENLPQWHEWKAVLERDFVSGIFLWTGIDYLGESAGAWPVKARACGLLDLAGFEKEQYHFFKTIWTDEPHTYIRTLPIDGSPYQTTNKGDIELKQANEWQTRLWDWHKANRHWNYEHGEEIAVEVFSNAEHVELFHNQQSLGIRQLSEQDDHIYKWRVPFEAGELKLSVTMRMAKSVNMLSKRQVVRPQSNFMSTIRRRHSSPMDKISSMYERMSSMQRANSVRTKITLLISKLKAWLSSLELITVQSITSPTIPARSIYLQWQLLVAMRTTQQAGDATLVCQASQDLESRIQIQIIGDTKQC